MPGAATEAKVAPLTPSVGPLNSGHAKAKPTGRGRKKHNKTRDFRHATSAKAPAAVADNLDPVHKTVNADNSNSGPNKTSPEAPARIADAPVTCPTGVNAWNTGNCPENASVNAKNIGICKALTSTLELVSAVTTFTFRGLYVAGSSYQMLLEDSVRTSTGDDCIHRLSGVDCKRQARMPMTTAQMDGTWTDRRSGQCHPCWRFKNMAYPHARPRSTSKASSGARPERVRERVQLRGRSRRDGSSRRQDGGVHCIERPYTRFLGAEAQFWCAHDLAREARSLRWYAGHRVSSGYVG